MADHNDLGRIGEDLAVNHLVSHGYVILDRNWRWHHLELDIVARIDNTIVFVEVKTRTFASNVSDLLSSSKMRNLVNAAEAYLRVKGYVCDARLDLFVVSRKPGGFDLQHIPGAFR